MTPRGEQNAATKIGISREEMRGYIAQRLRYCSVCKTWKSIDEVHVRRRRPDLAVHVCRACNGKRNARGARLRAERAAREVLRLYDDQRLRDVADTTSPRCEAIGGCTRVGRFVPRSGKLLCADHLRPRGAT